MRKNAAWTEPLFDNDLEEFTILREFKALMRGGYDSASIYDTLEVVRARVGREQIDKILDNLDAMDAMESSGNV